jgi:hypothetical protein
MNSTTIGLKKARFAPKLTIVQKDKRRRLVRGQVQNFETKEAAGGLSKWIMHKLGWMGCSRKSSDGSTRTVTYLCTSSSQ